MKFVKRLEDSSGALCSYYENCSVRTVHVIISFNKTFLKSISLINKNTFNKKN
jgi:hypothetical protein